MLLFCSYLLSFLYYTLVKNLFPRFQFWAVFRTTDFVLDAHVSWQFSRFKPQHVVISLDSTCCYVALIYCLFYITHWLKTYFIDFSSELFFEQRILFLMLMFLGSFLDLSLNCLLFCVCFPASSIPLTCLKTWFLYFNFDLFRAQDGRTWFVLCCSTGLRRSKVILCQSCLKKMTSNIACSRSVIAI